MTKETTLLGLMGFGIWLSGAVGFRLGGTLLFESGPLVLAIVALVMAASVCLLLKATMDWRKVPVAQSASVALIMTLGGLFGDVAYIADFSQITGLRPATAGPFAAVLIFATAALYLFALVRAARAKG
ncbi:DUF5367 family protein [Phenylobacterium sp.]|uniref:DUF5367 family protein n=1 Tax=Phenylobacterium sp. TaxID=1871053 RepID=UPI002B8AF615|nr:DUF5367 family protein [Phenylobacterium sp.]HLZ73772.1 DUF5367 family protein [Phenylobacterium sp.]